VQELDDAVADELWLVDAHDVTGAGKDLDLASGDIAAARLAAAVGLPTSPSFPPRNSRVGAWIIRGRRAGMWNGCPTRAFVYPRMRIQGSRAAHIAQGVGDDPIDGPGT
jgi:hypothetical protein